MEDGQEGDVREVTGQIVHKRALSKKLVFMDIKLTDSLSVGNQYVELVIKVGTYGDVAAIQATRDSFGLGDVIHAVGTLDSQGSLKVTAMTAISRWHPVKRVGGPQFQPDEEALAWWSQSVQGRKKTDQKRTTQQTTNPLAAGVAQQQRTAAGEAAQAAADRVVDQSLLEVVEVGGESKVLSDGSPPGVGSGTQGRESGAQGGDGSAQDVGEEGGVQGRGVTGVTSLSSHIQASQVCKWWINSGRCAHGSKCAFLHPTGQERNVYLKAWLADRKATRRVHAQQDGFFVHAPYDLASAKGHRASVLAKWMVDTWGKEALNVGSGVLDVAGGRGALSWELQVVHGVRVTLVEPREFKLDRNQHKFLKALAYQSMPPFTGANPHVDSSAPAPECSSPTPTPTPTPTPVNEPVNDPVNDPVNAMNLSQYAAGSTEESMRHQQDDHDGDGRAAQGSGGDDDGDGGDHDGDGRAAQGRGGDDGSDAGAQHNLGHDDQQQQDAARPVPTLRHIPLAAGMSITQITSWFDHQLWGKAVRAGGSTVGVTGSKAVDYEAFTLGADQKSGKSDEDEISSLIASCSVVVGLHPDQATEEILRFATTCEGGSKKPFCIVPCCVFPRLYPHRRLRRHEQLTSDIDTGSPGILPATAITTATTATASVLDANASCRVVDVGVGVGEPVLGASGGAVDAVGIVGHLRGDRGGDEGAGGGDRGDDAGMWIAPQELFRGPAGSVMLGTGNDDTGLDDVSVPVTTYSELVQYLVQEGGPGTREACLRFEGANKVVYRM